MTNGGCVACVTGISVCDAPCEIERETEVKRENKGRGAAGEVVRGRDRVLEKKTSIVNIVWKQLVSLLSQE